MKLIGNPITVGGLPWQGDKHRTVPTKTLTSNILCKHHNEMLSGLDQVGIRFFEKLRATRFERPMSELIACSRTSLFRGEMIELWMLKVLCGLIASGNAPDRRGNRINADISADWLGMLFERHPIPSDWGIYMPCEVGHVFGGLHPNRITVIYEDGTLNGLIVVLDQLGFVLVMNKPPAVRAGTSLENCTYRPGEIVINGKFRQEILRFFWERPGDEKSITIC